MFFGLISGLLFSFGVYPFNIAAGLLYFFSVVLDQCDGEIARLKYMESEAGHKLDIICDTILNAAIVAGITCSVYKTSGSGLTMVLGIEAIVGISVSTFVTTFSKGHNGEQMMDKANELHDRLNNKDFFYTIVIVCIAINQMIWFLLIMAIGTNLYWMTRKIFRR